MSSFMTMETAFPSSHDSVSGLNYYLIKNNFPENGFNLMSLPGNASPARGTDNMMSLPGNASPARGTDTMMSQETFHTPSFGDEAFDFTPINLPAVPESSQSLVQPGFQSQALSHQPSLDIPELNDLSQPLSHASNLSVNCSVLDSLNQNPQPVAPKFPPQTFDVPDISISNSVISKPNDTFSTGTITTAGLFHRNLTSSSSLHTNQEPLLTISQSQMTAQLGFHSTMKQGSPATSNSTSSPGRDSSDDSDDSLPLAQLASLKRAAVVIENNTVDVIKKQKTPKKKKKKDPNEPQKPVSAYALFFRDTQAAIKGQNPNASFGEVSKIVASMWDGLDPEHKSVYKKKTEAAKKEYLKQLAAYKASLVSQTPFDEPSAISEKAQLEMGTKSMVVPSMSGMTSSVGSSTQMTLVTADSQHPSIAYSSPIQSNMVSRVPVIQTIHDNLQRPVISQGIPSRTYITEMGTCVRNGCNNHAIDSPGWDSEYCSNECVVSHCRDVFGGWVLRQISNSFPVK